MLQSKGCMMETRGQTHKASPSVNYNSRVVLTIKLLIFTTQAS